MAKWYLTVKSASTDDTEIWSFREEPKWGSHGVDGTIFSGKDRDGDPTTVYVPHANIVYFELMCALSEEEERP